MFLQTMDNIFLVLKIWQDAWVAGAGRKIGPTVQHWQFDIVSTNRRSLVFETRSLAIESGQELLIYQRCSADWSWRGLGAKLVLWTRELSGYGAHKRVTGLIKTTYSTQLYWFSVLTNAPRGSTETAQRMDTTRSIHFLALLQTIHGIYRYIYSMDAFQNFSSRVTQDRWTSHVEPVKSSQSSQFRATYNTKSNGQRMIDICRKEGGLGHVAFIAF